MAQGVSLLESRPAYLDVLLSTGPSGTGSTAAQNYIGQSGELPVTFQNVDSRYREQHKPRRVIFYCNGDRYYPGKRINISPHRYRNFADLLNDLTNAMPGHIYLPNGVRQIFSSLHGSRITSLQELVDGGEYVCAGNESYKPIHYGRRAIPTLKDRPFYPGGNSIVPPAANYVSPEQQQPSTGMVNSVQTNPTDNLVARRRDNGSQYVGYNAFLPRRYIPRGGGYLRWQPGLSRVGLVGGEQYQSQAVQQRINMASMNQSQIGGAGILSEVMAGPVVRANGAYRMQRGTLGARPAVVPATVHSNRPKVITVVRNGASSKPRSVIKVLLNPASVQSFPQLILDISEAFGPAWKGRQAIVSLYTVSGRPVRKTADFFVPEDDVFIGLDSDEIRLADVQEILEDLYPEHPLVPNLLKEWKKWQARDSRLKQVQVARASAVGRISGSIEENPSQLLSSHGRVTSTGMDQEKRDSGFDESEPSHGKIVEEVTAEAGLIKLGEDNIMTKTKDLNLSVIEVSASPGDNSLTTSQRRQKQPRTFTLQQEAYLQQSRLLQQHHESLNEIASAVVPATTANKNVGLTPQFDYEEWQRARIRTQKRLLRDKRGSSVEDNRRIPLGVKTSVSNEKMSFFAAQKLPSSQGQPFPLLKQIHGSVNNLSQTQSHQLLNDDESSMKVPNVVFNDIGATASNNATASIVTTLETQSKFPPPSPRISKQPLPTINKVQDKILTTVQEEAPHEQQTLATPFTDDLKVTLLKAEHVSDEQSRVATSSVLPSAVVVTNKNKDSEEVLLKQKPRDIVTYEEPPLPPAQKKPEKISVQIKVAVSANEQRTSTVAQKPDQFLPKISESNQIKKPLVSTEPTPKVLNVVQNSQKLPDPKQLRQISGPHRVSERYELGRTLGDGNFAVVRYARHRVTNHEYAIKVIDKSKLRGKEVMIENEISIMKLCHHPNIVKLKEEFETKTEIYLVMELIKGGDLFDAITQSVKFPEDKAACMVRDMAEALFYLHSRNILHRDLKPENLMVVRHKDGSLNLKLADFGLAMEVKRLIFTVCGTPTYVAPEILEEKGYGLEVDMWALGVICYILLCGFPPFRSPDRKQTELFELIKAGEYEFLSPYWDNVSHSAKDLIEHLLLVDRKRRYTAIDVLCHPWVFTQGNRIKINDQPISEYRIQLRSQLEVKSKAEMAAFMKQKLNVSQGHGTTTNNNTNPTTNPSSEEMNK